jgi:hypothetical protein
LIHRITKGEEPRDLALEDIADQLVRIARRDRSLYFGCP